MENVEDCKITFAGKPVSRTLFYAAKSCSPFFTGECDILLRTIHTEFGRKVLSKDYTKLYAACALVKKMAQQLRVDQQALFQFVLEGVLFELRNNVTSVEKISNDGHFNGTYPGRVGMFIWKYLIVRY